MRSLLPLSVSLALALLPRPGSAAVIHLAGGDLDPSRGATSAALPPALDADGRALLAVQLAGPTRPPWLDALRATGARVHGYLPERAYLVSATEAELSALEALAFVRWTGAIPPELKLLPALQAAAFADPEARVELTVLATDRDAGDELAARGAKVESNEAKATGWWRAHVTVFAAQLPDVARLPTVFYVEPRPQYRLHGERGAQVAAGAYDAGACTPSGPGYTDFLAAHGLVGGPGLVVQVQDDGLGQGIASNEPGTIHEDLRGRVEGIFNATSDPLGDSRGGHGQINAGIIAGNATLGTTDAAGYRLGQGMAPAARVYGTKIFQNDGYFDVGPWSFTDLAADAQDAGARFSSNSWGASVFGAYNADSAEFDALARDADPGEPGLQPMIYFFSAGNAGPGPQSLASPATAKNVIAVGAAEGSDASGTDGCGIEPDQADCLRDLASFSSRGPTADGRLGVTLVAPGTHVQGPAPTGTDYDGARVCDAFWPAGQTDYARSSGTSHSCPMAAGAGVVAYEWFESVLGAGPGNGPSPALMRALLTNTAMDLSGGDDGAGGALGPVPDPSQGWGSVHLGNLLASQHALHWLDQTQVLAASGESFELQLTPVDPGKPMKVTLAWTDPPALPGASPVLVNDLDLVVDDAGTVYRGNVFSGGFSLPGGVADTVNNLEAVYLPSPTGAPVTIRIEARNLAGDALPSSGGSTDQDFALFASNATAQTSAATIAIEQASVRCEGEVTVVVSDADARDRWDLVGLSSSAGDLETLPVWETAPGTGVLSLTVQTEFGAADPRDGVMQVADGMTIVAVYLDQDDGTGASQWRTATTTVDCSPPVIQNLEVAELHSNQATVRFDTSEISTGLFGIGPDCDSLARAGDVSWHSTEHTFTAAGLTPTTRYYFAVFGADAAWNTTIDDNGGACHTFVTPQRPDYATELFALGDSDLAEQRVLFEPDGSVSYYAACRDPLDALPTDPNGGTSLALGDDEAVLVTLADGAEISLYGQQAGSFWVGSNGYITLGEGDLDYTQSFVDHFDLPRVSALFDDFHPGLAGEVSWRQLEDRVAVTWRGVSQFKLPPDASTFQAELFFDGRIQLSWLGLDSPDGLAGLSAGGGVPVDFVESDLSAYPPCVLSAGVLELSPAVLRCEDTLNFNLRDRDLENDGSAAVLVITGSGDAESLTLHESSPGTFEGSVVVRAGTPAPYDDVVSVQHGESVEARYFDMYPELFTQVSAEAVVDCEAPTITGVDVSDVGATQVHLEFRTAEPATGSVSYGLSCDDLSETVVGPADTTYHSFTIGGLDPETEYFAVVSATDVAGNTFVDDDGGGCYALGTRAEANFGFELGDFTSWQRNDVASPFFPLQVGGAGITPRFGLFESAPTEGSFAALHGWEGAGPGSIRLEREIAVPVTPHELRFDYRAGWNLAFRAELPRHFEVRIEPAGGGAPLYVESVLTITPPDAQLDGGAQVGSVDLAPFAGQTVRVVFHWSVPEFYTGPAFFQLDNVREVPTSAGGTTTAPPPPGESDPEVGPPDGGAPSAIPALGAPAALALMLLLLGVGVGVRLRRRDPGV